MSGRTQRILGRFPAHLEAARPGKRLESVVGSLAGDFDVLSAELAAVRRAHRLGHADTLADLLLLAGLHGLGGAEMALLLGRGGDLSRALLLDAVRARVARTAAIHAAGNGTVRALLAGAANALDLDLVEPIAHSPDRFWHAAFVQDRLAPPPQSPPPDPAPPPEEVIGLEENPQRRETTGRVGRSHGELFSWLRRGFTDRGLEIRITGDAQGRTIGPMLVNRDEGHGVGYLGVVGPGKTLLFTADGKVEIDGEDASGLAWSWRGACFATDGAPTGKDFVFDGPGLKPDAQARVAEFAKARPLKALTGNDDDTGPDGALEVPGIGVGETRFAFFVREAHFLPAGPEQELPLPYAALFDSSVFAPPDEHGAGRPTAAEVELSWIENEAYAVRVLIPERFRDLNKVPPETVLRDVAIALRRFQPLGVEVRVEFQEKHWTVGDGVLGANLDDPLGRVQPGMILWPAPEGAD